MCSRRFSYVSNARGLGRSAAAGTSLVTRVPRRSLAWSSAKLLGGHQRGDQRGNRWQSEAIIRGRSERPSEAIRGNQRSSGLGGSHTRGSLMIYEAGNQRPSEAIRGHQRSSEVIRGHQTSSDVIRRHQRPSEVIRGHQRSSEAERLLEGARVVVVERVEEKGALGRRSRQSERLHGLAELLLVDLPTLIFVPLSK
jgi:hypothetical protein